MRAPARAILILACSLSWGPLAAPATPADRALELALQAIKMAPRDLGFQKTNAPSRFVLPAARRFLEDPLALPPYADRLRDELSQIERLEQVTRLGGSLALPTPPAGPAVGRARLPPSRANAPHPAPSPAPAALLAAAATVSPRLRPILGSLYTAAETAAREINAATPANAREIFAAWAVETIDLRRDPDELRAWETAGLDPAAIRHLLQRAADLELQDAELLGALLSADPALLDATRAAFADLGRALDRAIRDLRAAIAADPALRNPFQVECATPLGNVSLGGAGPNTYAEDAFLIVDTGGDDRYENNAGGANGLLSRPVAIVIDCAGNDRYRGGHSFTQGAGLFGVGFLVDLGGDDQYDAKHVSQGAGLYGAGLLADWGGTDTFAADSIAQGAALFGSGILWQRAGDSLYQARQTAQGYGSTLACGLLLDQDGHDRYVAGGKYPCGWIPDHYFTLAQGFGHGLRPLAGGGLGILADLRGNDRYQADVYGQGASYWYALGLLLDPEGDDVYQAHQYCQGAGIHLSTGGLFDTAGNDTYTASAICQGAAHDYSVGFLIDSAGNDAYTGNTTAQGTAINASFALLLDAAGDDSYTGTDPAQSQAAGHDGDKRECGSIALLLDLAGADRYSQGQTNGALWLKPFYGAGLDCEPAAENSGSSRRPAGARVPTRPSARFGAGLRPAPESPWPPIRPADPRHPTERLLRRALRDAVTPEEQADAAAANAELKERCLEVLPYVLSRCDTPQVMIRVKAEELVDLASTNSVPALIGAIDHAANEEVARVCCYFLARFETATNAIPHVLPLLHGDKTISTALYTLGHLRARAAFRPAQRALADPREPVRLRAAQALGRIGDARAVPRLIAALDDPYYTVRYAAQDALARIGPASIRSLHRSFGSASNRARPHIVEALAKLGDPRALALAHRLRRAAPPQLRNAVRRQLADYLEGAPAL